MRSHKQDRALSFEERAGLMGDEADDQTIPIAERTLYRSSSSTSRIGAAVVLSVFVGGVVCGLVGLAAGKTRLASIGLAAPTEAVVLAQTSCVKSNGRCRTGDSCCSSDDRCYSRNEFEAHCMKECQKVDKHGNGWSCMVVDKNGYEAPPPSPPAPANPAPANPAPAKPAPTPAPAPGPPQECSWEGENCKDSNCCRREGFQCFEQAEGKWAGCSTSCDALKSTGGDWSCKVLGGDQGVNMVSQAEPGKEAGTSLFCFVVVTGDGVTAPGVKPGYEMDLWDVMHSNKVGVCACDAWSKYSGGKVQTGDWSSVVNTDIFTRVWGQVHSEGKYKQHDWTVKQDADAVFFPDRLKAHLKGLKPPKDTPVYLHNIDFKFKFQGALEVLSKDAAEVFIANLGTCGDHLGHNGGEDLFTMQCLDAMKVGFMEDFKILDDKYTHPPGWNLADVDTCKDQSIVAYHPYKAKKPWWGCYQVSMKQKKSSDFVACDKRWPGDACSLSSSLAH